MFHQRNAAASASVNVVEDVPLQESSSADWDDWGHLLNEVGDGSFHFAEEEDLNF